MHGAGDQERHVVGQSMVLLIDGVDSLLLGAIMMGAVAVTPVSVGKQRMMMTMMVPMKRESQRITSTKRCVNLVVELGGDEGIERTVERSDGNVVCLTKNMHQR